MDIEYQQKQLKILYKRIYEEVFKLDLYSQPLSLTYQGKTNFSTSYGMIMTFITMFLILFVIIDTLFYGQAFVKYEFSSATPSSLTIQFPDQMAFYFYFENNKTNLVDIFDIKFYTLNYNQSGNNYNGPYKLNNDFGQSLVPCNENSYWNKKENKSHVSALCFPSITQTYTITDIYMSAFQFKFSNKTPTYINENEISLDSLMINYNDIKNDFDRTYINKKLRFDNQTNFQYTTLSISKTTQYSGYFNILKETYNYYLKGDMDIFSSSSSDNTSVLSLQLNLISQTDETYISNVNWLNSISIIAGYMFLFYSAVKFCVTKCANVKLYESIANQTFNLIAPEIKNKLLESEKTLKDKLTSDEIQSLILDLAVDEFYKYNENRGISLSFWQLQNYICCFSCCKNKNQIQIEKTLQRALDELFKSIDVINVIKCFQEIKVLKEILFDPNQRQIFEHLLRPCIIDDKVISSYNNELLSSLTTDEEVHIMQKSGIKDAFMHLSKQENYSEIEMKLIDLIFINSALKKKFFNVEEKEQNNKNNYLKILSSNIFDENSADPRNFQSLVQFVEEESVTITKIIEETIVECNEVAKDYKLMCDENKILKSILFNNYDKGINPKVKKLNNYHPLIMNKDQNDTQLNLMKRLYTNNTNNNFLDQFEGIVGLFFDFLDLIFCIKSSEKYIITMFNSQTLQAFRAITHPLKISVLCMMTFSTFNIISIINNFNLISAEPRYSLISIGYLSFSRNPDNITVIFVYSLIIYIILQFCYVLFLLIVKFLSDSESNFIENNYPLAKIFFTSPTLRINSEDEKNFFHSYFIQQILNLTDQLSEMSTRNLIINTIVFSISCLIMIGNLNFSFYLNSFGEDSNNENFLLETIEVSILRSIASNICPSLVLIFTNFYMDLLPQTVEKLRFWMPFFTKFSSYTIILFLNFQIFMSKNTKFNSDRFVCREDQAAYNLLVFMMIEFLMRKFFTIIFSIFTYKLRLKCELNSLITHVMCTFYILNITTLIYPAQGFFSFLIFFLDYRIEMFILRNFRTPPLTILKPEAYEEYTLFCLTLNLIVIIIINIFFQNQSLILKNDHTYNTSISTFCNHTSNATDFQNIFQTSMNESFIEGLQSLQMFIFVPSFIVIFQILVNSKKIIKEFGNHLKFLLRMIHDKHYNQIFSKINTNILALNKIFQSYDIKKDEMVRTAKLRKKSVYDPNKNIIMDINDEEEIKIVGN